MATIKPIEGRSVHQIQSGQVIVDLRSVVKELVENSLDAGATSIEVRFKNNGLDSIEVQDNGSGISPANYESVALKHYTSKLSTYDDLTNLQTFGFRGEALSSLCALSHFQMLTAQANEVPKGKKLEFEISGKLKSTSVVACKKGTTVIVEGIFQNLPVRRKELTKNIKREYNKVTSLLHAYACISTGIKFTVKSSMPKGKSVVSLTTKGNSTTRENIANIYGAKTLSALIPLELELEFSSSTSFLKSNKDSNMANKIIIRGHISRPIFGEGRQAPDRQMFFVNSRPCDLPQISKAMNEVYKTFNLSQSPFIFVNLVMDTNAYDVNVSPDKRTILLHDSANLIESLKASLLEAFEKQEQTVPQSSIQTPKLPAYKQLTINRQSSSATPDQSGGLKAKARDVQSSSDDASKDSDNEEEAPQVRNINDFFRDHVSTRPDPDDNSSPMHPRGISKAKENLARKFAMTTDKPQYADEDQNITQRKPSPEPSETGSEFENSLYTTNTTERHEQDPNALIAEQNNDDVKVLADTDPTQSKLPKEPVDEGLTIPRHQPNIIQDAFNRMRPKRSAPETATITVGDKTITTTIGTQPQKKRKEDHEMTARSSLRSSKTYTKVFSQQLRGFAAPGTQVENDNDDDDEDDDDYDAGDSDDHEEDIHHSSDEKVQSTVRSTRKKSELHEISDEESVNDDLETEHIEEQDGNEENEEKRTNHLAEDMLSETVSSEANQKDDLDQDLYEEADASDQDYIDEKAEKLKEQERVAELIRRAEEKESLPSQDNIKRATKMMKSGNHRDSTAHLITRIDGSIDRIEEQSKFWKSQTATFAEYSTRSKRPLTLDEGTAEERLSLTVSKKDFSNMSIIGQFNLGFILAIRPKAGDQDTSGSSKRRNDELFIIDQHASDEKYNFERLQVETVVGNQRLVRPKLLELTAVEEEIILENMSALEKNGFLVDVDTSGDEAIGQRCKLISLPLSKEVVFDESDLEELLHLLSEAPGSGSSSVVPRPSKVRKMFAMRACRSSIMIGKTLTMKQMSTVVRHMGEMDKPWNCPHGRPTMRHLMSLDDFEPWTEGDGLVDDEEDDYMAMEDVDVWAQFA